MLETVYIYMGLAGQGLKTALFRVLVFKVNNVSYLTSDMGQVSPFLKSGIFSSDDIPSQGITPVKPAWIKVLPTQ